jgi:hypothetical protein
MYVWFMLNTIVTLNTAKAKSSYVREQHGREGIIENWKTGPDGLIYEVKVFMRGGSIGWFLLPEKMLIRRSVR